MSTETEQQRTTEMLHKPQAQVRVKRALRVSLERQIRASRMPARPALPESGLENVSDMEWLSTSIVHDLRNPVATIYAAAEMLLDLDTGLTQVHRLATNIYRAARRMRECLADLNCVALGKTPTPEMCNIREVITSASNAALAGTQNRSVQILLEVPESIELPLIRVRMQSVFFNLIANALEAMPTGGRLHMAARKAGTYVLIEMEDTGPGISDKIRDRLFEPFVTAGKQNGLGLGLALARQAVLNHGGDIWTEPASGARFVIRLPLQRARSSQSVHMLAESSTTARVSERQKPSQRLR
jgi:signal transduction histidine kinase